MGKRGLAIIMPIPNSAFALFHKFKKYNELHGLFNEGETVLLACSGGIDSMVLFHLLLQLKQPFAVAHVNYQLRGKESDDNHEFVKACCIKYQIKLHDLIAALQNGPGIQEKARNVRYRFFEAVLRENNYSKLLTAHHADDQLETMLYNLARGSGLKGIGGMKLKSNWITRPLLFVAKEKIIEFANANQIEFSADSSNEKTDYSRNLIRNKVIPILNSINPQLSSHAFFTSQIVQNSIYELATRRLSVPFKLLKEEILRQPYPFEWINQKLSDFGFSRSQLESIFELLKNNKSGKIFQGKLAKLILTKSGILVCGNYSSIPIRRLVSIPETIETPLGNFEFSLIDSLDDNLYKHEQALFLDIDKIQGSLYLTKIPPGMRFKPPGLKGSKKVNDYLSDKGISILEKENTYCLVNENKLVAILPYVVSTEFLPDVNTEFVLSIAYKY